MVEDKIKIALKDIARFKEELKGIKKDMKVEEKIDDVAYIELKAAYKEMRAQLKDTEDESAENLRGDDFYNELRELRLKKEEDLALATKALFDAVAKLPARAMQMKMETDDGFMNVQIQPEMKVYINGKEEKAGAAVVTKSAGDTTRRARSLKPDEAFVAPVPVGAPSEPVESNIE